MQWTTSSVWVRRRNAQIEAVQIPWQEVSRQLIHCGAITSQRPPMHMHYTLLEVLLLPLLARNRRY